MSHTPGPWTPVRQDHVKESWAVEATDSPTGYVGHLGVGFSFADARLIAAAPELYEALKVAEQAIHSEYCTSKCCAPCLQAAAAIAKAEGR